MTQVLLNLLEYNQKKKGGKATANNIYPKCLCLKEL